LKSEPDLATTPVMLLSNHENYQRQALAVGAEPGFGKEQFDTPEMIEGLRRYLD